jgi:predicted Rossmann fold flavoprotein
MHDFDAIVIGAGAAGLYCAGIAGRRGLRVLVIDHAARVGEKIRISGGGRCNFTNRGCSPAQFVSDNPHFCRSALARCTPEDFIALLRRHGIGFHEKHRGQLFCDGSAEQIVVLLLAECAAGAVRLWHPCAVHAVRHGSAGFEIDCDRGTARAPQLVVATGGLSIPKIGASDFGYRLARQFGHDVIVPRPGLVPLVFDAASWAPFAALSGLSLEVGIAAGSGKAQPHFVEDLLFTHRGLSGPAVLQASSFWAEGDALQIDLTPGRDLSQQLRQDKLASRRQLGNQLALYLPQRLADTWLTIRQLDAQGALRQLRDRDLAALGDSLRHWQIVPVGSEGWRKAEVTVGGVDTKQLDSRSLQSRRVPGLFFIGEVVDVTGWLGGYNFQWSWASAAACALSLAGPLRGREPL